MNFLFFLKKSVRQNLQEKNPMSIGVIFVWGLEGLDTEPKIKQVPSVIIYHTFLQ